MDHRLWIRSLLVAGVGPLVSIVSFGCETVGDASSPEPDVRLVDDEVWIERHYTAEGEADICLDLTALGWTQTTDAVGVRSKPPAPVFAAETDYCRYRAGPMAVDTDTVVSTILIARLGAPQIRPEPDDDGGGEDPECPSCEGGEH